MICAEASFVGERTVKGGDVAVQAPLVIINTGTSSLIPEIPGLAGTPYLTNRNFFDLSTKPARLLVIGGGYIGLELGQGLARLGSQTKYIILIGNLIYIHPKMELNSILLKGFC